MYHFKDWRYLNIVEISLPKKFSLYIHLEIQTENLFGSQISTTLTLPNGYHVSLYLLL
jgi:hypothetical protein